MIDGVEMKVCTGFFLQEPLQNLFVTSFHNPLSNFCTKGFLASFFSMKGYFSYLCQSVREFDIKHRA